MSKKEYKINEPQPSNAELDKLKDFDKVIQNVPTAPTASQNFWTKLIQPQGLATITSIVVVGSVTAYVLLREPQETTDDSNVAVIEENTQNSDNTGTTINYSEAASAPTSSRSRINPPLPDWDVPYELFIIDASVGGELVSQNGSLISVGPNFFKDADGNPVTGNIEIKYREFHDPIAIFLSGVPMEYDTLGEKHTFESAGMLEIFAEQNGKPVLLAEGKTLSIELVSLNEEEKGFNVYRFDTTKGEWDYIDECSTKEFTDHKQIAKEASNINMTKPEKPVFRLWDKNKYAFKAEVDLAKFPELNNDAMFVVNDSLSEFDPLWYKVQWDEISLDKSQNKGHYTLNLKKENTNVSLEAYPVLSREKLKDVITKYEYNLMKYEKSQGKDSKFTFSSYPKTTTDKQRKVANMSNLGSNPQRQGNSLLRTLWVTALGWWNCDRVYMADAAPNIRSVRPTFTDKEKKPLPSQNIFNVTGNTNALFTNERGTYINYSTTKKNTMWIVMDNDSIALANPEDFKRITGTKYEFAMTVYPAEEALEILEKLRR